MASLNRAQSLTTRTLYLPCGHFQHRVGHVRSGTFVVFIECVFMLHNTHAAGLNCKKKKSKWRVHSKDAKYKRKTVNGRDVSRLTIPNANIDYIRPDYERLTCLSVSGF